MSKKLQKVNKNNPQSPVKTDVHELNNNRQNSTFPGDHYLHDHGGEPPKEISQQPGTANQVGTITGKLIAATERIGDVRAAVRESTGNEKIKQRHVVWFIVSQVRALSKSLHYNLAFQNGFPYIYQGQFWLQIERGEFKRFLSQFAKKLGLPEHESDYFEFQEKLDKQFVATETGQIPPSDPNRVLVNTLSGTLEINRGQVHLRPHRPSDFLTYVLPFAYNPQVDCPTFHHYLNRVLPQENARAALQEFVGYLFAKGLKLEKVLILLGPGRNGKSVFFEIVSALIGQENISHFSLSELMQEHYRALIGNKLVNYSSEISGGKTTGDTLKTLASGEPISARLKYGNPFILTEYSRFIFNANQLPTDVENTTAFFERFLIVPFREVIPENERDPNLAKKIIAAELPGILNWAIEGLKRIVTNEHFTQCDEIKEAGERYRRESNSAMMFIESSGYEPDSTRYQNQSLKMLYFEYKEFCDDDGYRPLGKRNFKSQLEQLGFELGRLSDNSPIFYIKKK